MRKVLSGIVFTIWAISLFAQSEVSQNFTIINGLPSNRVYHSMVDAQGFVWFSTDKGVSRYDGYSFTNFTTGDGLTDNEVFNMFEDSKHRIWFMTYSGKLSYYKEGVFYNPQNTPMLQNAIIEGMFSRAFEDKWGNMVFITSADGFYVLNGTTFKHCFKEHGLYSPYLVKGEIYLSVNAIDTAKLIKIKKDGSYIAIDSTLNTRFSFYNWQQNDSLYSISAIEKSKKEWKLLTSPPSFYDFTTGSSIETEKNISPFYIKNIKGKVYAGTNKGLYFLDVKKSKLEPIGFSEEQVSSICFDFEDNLWVTTLQHGVFLQPKINLKKYKGISENINEVEINPYTQEVWAGNPRSLYRIGNSSPKKCVLPQTPSYNEKITSFYFINNEELIVGSDLCLAYYHDNKFHPLSGGYSGAKTISYDHYTKKPIGAFASGLAYIEFENSKFPQKIIGGRSIAALALNNNRLLVASNNGLYEVNKKTGKKKLVLNSRITQIKQDSAGNIWCSSDVAGLYLYKNGKFKHFTEHEGLHSNNINKLTIDSKQRLWLTSPLGIIKAVYSNNTLKIENYILSSILGKEQVNDVAIKHDTVLIATTAGLYYFKENQFKPQHIEPPLVINSITIEGKPQAIATSYTLNSEQNNIHVAFTALSYATQNLNYRYVLSSTDKEWQYSSTRSVNLVDLNPGKYILTIQAIKDGTILSQPKQIEFIIVPPFYKAWWFYLALVALGAILFTIIIRYRINTIRRRAYISQVIAESKQKALRAQMNPHFLFNSLISIQSFFLNKRNTEGQEYTSKFSKLIRNILDNSDREFITIDDEVDTLKNYTDLENIRLKTPFIFIISISDVIDPNNTYIPTMLLQPIIENSIWHGINYLKNQQGKIEVTFTKKENDLIITVEDNGVGFAKSAEINKKRNHISKGNKLVKERLEAINIKRKNNVSYLATDQAEGGAIVTLIIPLEE